MRTLSFWDYGLICESLIFIVFIVFVALEFCSTSYAIDTSLGSEIRKTIYLFVLIGSVFRVVSIICHVFMVLPEFCRVFVITMLEETTNLVFVTGLSLQIVFLVQIYYALLNLSQPAIRRIFVSVMMSVYVIMVLLIVMCLFVNINFVLRCVNFVMAILCLFCLISLVVYGTRIFVEMKNLEVSKTVVRKMIIIMTISSITFAFRAVLEILFFFDITLLDFDETTKGNMHVIGSHIYASAMYFFFYYFLAEINPLTILLLSTYIRPQKPTTYSNYRTEIHNPAPTPAPSSTIFRTPRSNHSFLRSKTNLKEDELRQGLLASSSEYTPSISIQLSQHVNSKKYL